MRTEIVRAVYWSAAGSTKKAVLTAARAAAEQLGLPLEECDWTLPAAREQTRTFAETDLVFFGMPTYAGKLPNKMLPFVQSLFNGGGALAAAVVTFGNRSYDHALAELCAELEACGFHTVSAAAFACRHVFSNTLAAGRPDAADLEQITAFGRRTAEKTAALTELPAPVQVPGAPDAPYYVPKGTDGQPAKFLKAKPQTDAAKCTRCGLCARVCPMGAIDPADPASVPGTCIKCHACVRRCPAGAKYFDDPAFLSHKAMLEQTFQRRAEPELFF